MNALQIMDRYRKELIQVSTGKNDIKVQYLYDKSRILQFHVLCRNTIQTFSRDTTLIFRVRVGKNVCPHIAVPSPHLKSELSKSQS